jgi:hypothetical protein
MTTATKTTQTNTTGTRTRQPKSKNLDDVSVILNLQVSKIGNAAQVPTALVEIKADRDRIRVIEDLLRSEELKAISRWVGQARNWLYTRAITSPYLRAGMLRLPYDLMKEVDERLEFYQAGFNDLVEQFVQVYFDQVKEAEIALDEAFQPEKYKQTEDEVRQCFSFEWTYLQASTPGRLGTISADILDREREKAATRASAEVATLQAALRTEVAKLCDDVIDKLSGGKDGKPKTFKTMVETVNDFLNVFSARNIAGDVDLEKQITKAQAAMAGIESSDSLKADGKAQAKVLKAFTGIRDKIDEPDEVIPRPTRKFKS